MQRGTNWECDVCQRKTIADGYPKEWYQVEIRKGSYFHNDEGDDFVLNKECCSEKCLRATLRTYLGS